MTYAPRDHLTPEQQAVLDRIPSDQQDALVASINEWFDAPPADGSTDPIVAQFCAAVGLDTADTEVADGVRWQLFQFRDSRTFEPRRLLCLLAASFTAAEVD